MKRLEKRERILGKGVVLRGGKKVADVGYRLLVLQEMIADATFSNPDAEIPGLLRISGSVSAEPRALFDLFQTEPRELVLCLEDGRRLDCFLTDIDGSIAPRGGLGIRAVRGQEP